MQYQPVTCVWEVTEGCNMRCGHCGSSCAESKPDELNTEEALDVCRQIAELGVKWVTLSGGKPLTRYDIFALVHELHAYGVVVNMISNGWLLNEDTVSRLKENGIATVAISIDGPSAVHDSIRKPGAFKHAEEAFKLLKKYGIQVGSVTTVSEKNIHELDSVKEELIRMGVASWQLQLGLPMGNFKKQENWTLVPEQVNDIIDFCYRTSEEGRIIVYPADCIGYYSKKEGEIRKKAFHTSAYPLWDGCNAGMRGFGILQNGNILGCTSIRNSKYIEGNIKKQALRDIWCGENSFAWRRNMKKSELGGVCKTCKYGSKCLGGCPNTRLTMNGSIYSENAYCSYNVAIKKDMANLRSINDAVQLFRKAQEYAKRGRYQQTVLYLDRLLELDSENIEALKLQGFADYMIGNLDECEQANRSVLEKAADDSYALHGLEIALFRKGEKDKGISLLERAVFLAPRSDMDMVHDLIILYGENGQREKAGRLYNETVQRFPGFAREQF